MAMVGLGNRDHNPWLRGDQQEGGEDRSPLEDVQSSDELRQRLSVDYHRARVVRDEKISREQDLLEIAALPLDQRLQVRVAELYLTVRSVNALESIGAITVEDFLRKQPAEIINIPSFGEKTYEQIRKTLRTVGFSILSYADLCDRAKQDREKR